MTYMELSWKSKMMWAISLRVYWIVLTKKKVMTKISSWMAKQIKIMNKKMKRKE